MRSNSYSYSKLTKEILDNAINTVFNKAKQLPNYTIFTDIIGYISFDIAFLRSVIPAPMTYISRIKKGKYLVVISIGEKHGTIKAYYNLKTNSFDMKKGSELLFTFNSFSNETFNKIKKYL